MCYLTLLFGVAWWGERLENRNSSFLNNPWVYALSLAVYCTAWTFYGSVGRAASTGIGFLPIYLGPTLMAPLAYIIVRKMIVISGSQHLTSLADFISSRYGKSAFLGSLVTVITLVGIIPYISLQLKAVSSSYELLRGGARLTYQSNFYEDSAFYVALVLAIFTIVFGARHLDATRKHSGLVAAIAFESLVKLIAFVSLGMFVTFGLFDGFGDIFQQASSIEEVAALYRLEGESPSPWTWFYLILISMIAVLLLPRQFHISIVENKNQEHVRKAIWIFPLYLLLINIFVLPVAFGGKLLLGGGPSEADAYVLSLPLSQGQEELALFVFIGGLSAATGMVIVSTIALSLMITNNLVVPTLLRFNQGSNMKVDISSNLIGLRRVIIVVILMLAYGYYRFIGGRYALVSIGLVSFVAVAQFAPATFGGLYWKGGSKLGATLGLILGFLVWGFTLPFPSLGDLSFIPHDFVKEGLFGLSWLKPYALFGLEGLDPVSHATFWSLLFNCLGYVVGSLFSNKSVLEHTQSSLFVDIHKHVQGVGDSRMLAGRAQLGDLRLLLNRFLGKSAADHFLVRYAEKKHIDLAKVNEIDTDFVNEVERVLGGSVGASSARLLVSSVVEEENLNLAEVMDALDETQQLIRYSRALEKKSTELEAATRELRAANQRLKDMDRIKDDFITTVTHELRTPITSIRALSGILYTKPDLEAGKREEFLRVITQECARVSKIINEVLDLEKMESGHASWNVDTLSIEEVIEDSLSGLQGMITSKGVQVYREVAADLPKIKGDKDRLVQVVVNLISNAIKFVPQENGRIWVDAFEDQGQIHVVIKDNGEGIEAEALPYIFQKFQQFNDYRSGRQGSGLGLSISQKIIHFHKGSIDVTSVPGEGATFVVRLPVKVANAQL
jgi:Na+/proline symporter/signal transduction histidine kinase